MLDVHLTTQRIGWARHSFAASTQASAPNIAEWHVQDPYTTLQLK